MKRKLFTVCFICLTLVFSALPASAAQLVQSSSTVVLPNQLPIAQTWCASANMPMQQIYTLTDNDPNSAWDAASAGINHISSAYVMLSLAEPATVTDIWLRNGYHASSVDYITNGYPTQVTVHLWRRLESGGNVQAAQYTYEMHDAYLPDVYTDSFYGGYQRLALPIALDDIISIVINIDRWQTQIGSSTVMISDAAICGTVSSTPSTVMPEPFIGSSAIYAVLNQKIATRTGPSTRYTEPGTFLTAGDTVQVISLAYDSNGVPWVQVDFTAYGGHRRAYTGLKRLDISAGEIPEEYPLNYSAVIRQDVTPRYGPGTGYMKHKDVTLYAGESATVISRENGWMMLEIARPAQPLMRVWVEESCVSW